MPFIFPTERVGIVYLASEVHYGVLVATVVC